MIKILYVRDRFGKNYGTVVYDISNRSLGSVKFAVASCNPNDVFSKHVGIDVAMERLSSSPTTLTVKANCPTVDIVQSILKKISRSDLGSCSLRKHCRKMLKRYQNNSFHQGCC